MATFKLDERRARPTPARTSATRPMAPGATRKSATKIAAKAQQTVTDPQLKTHMEYWADALSRGGGWFAGGDFTAADIMMSFPLEAAASRIGLDRPEYRPIQDFLARIHARPAYHRALEQGGDGVVARRLVEPERVGETLGRGHDEPGRVDEGVELQEIEPGKIRIAEPAGDQRGVEQQQRGVGGGHDRVALGDRAGAALRPAKPASGMAGVERGEGQRVHAFDDGAGRTKSKRGRARLAGFLSQSSAESRGFSSTVDRKTRPLHRVVKHEKPFRFSDSKRI